MTPCTLDPLTPSILGPSFTHGRHPVPKGEKWTVTSLYPDDENFSVSVDLLLCLCGVGSPIRSRSLTLLNKPPIFSEKWGERTATML